MRIAVLSDIHGNVRALEAVLERLAPVRPDLIICLGDVIDPLPRSREALRRLTDLAIPVLRGNHEDYVIAALDGSDPAIARLPNWAPVRQVAAQFDAEALRVLKQLPFSLPLTDTRAGEILFVHASPRSNRAGWRVDVSPELAEDLRAENARTLVGGHWHHQVTRTWEDKILVTVGSVGIPLAGQHEAEYAVLEPAVGGWDVQHLKVAYDAEATLKEFREAGFAFGGGPMAWMTYEEIRTARRTMGAFFEWLRGRDFDVEKPDSLVHAVKAFLSERGSWKTLVREIGPLETWPAELPK